MTCIAKNICLYIVISAVINMTTQKIESDFLITFLEKNLVTLLIALLAINTTTISIIMVKLRELKDKFDLNFETTLSSLKIAIYEQVSLIPLSILLLVLRKSNVINASLKSSHFILDTLLVATFAYAIHILFDTARGVFIIISAENK